MFQKPYVVFALTSLAVIVDGRAALSARPDAFTTSTLGGAEIFTQSIFIRDHVPAPMSSQDRLFRRRREASGELEARRDESSGFAWELGYAFSWPATDSRTESMLSHSGHLGVDFEISPSWAVSAVAQGDMIPDQSYGHGRLGLRLEAFVPLFSIPEEPSPEMSIVGSADLEADPEDRLEPVVVNNAPIVRADEERDARTYYFKSRKRRLDVPEDLRYRARYRKQEEADRAPIGNKANSAPIVDTGPRISDSPYAHYDDDEEPPPPPPRKLPPEPLYPHMTVALILDFDQHVRDLGTELSLTFPLTSGDDLSQLTAGGELAIQIQEGFMVYVSGLFSSYSSKISTFLTGLPSVDAATFIMPASILTAFQPHYLAFPGIVFEEGASFEVDRRWTLGLAFNQVLYASAGAGLGLGFAPAVTYSISRDWRLGLGAGICVGGPAGGTVLGVLNLAYLF